MIMVVREVEVTTGGEGSGSDNRGDNGGEGSGGDNRGTGESDGGQERKFGVVGSYNSGDHITAVTFQATFTSNEDIQSSQRGDKDLKPLLDGMLDGKIPSSTHPGLRKCFLTNGILCREYVENGVTHHTQIVVPSNLRNTVLCQLHDHSGHLGLKKTLGKVKERFYWPGYESNTEAYIVLAGSVRHVIPHIHSRRPPWEQSELLDHLKRYHGISWGHSPHLNRATNTSW